MNKLETKLSKKWIDNLKDQCYKKKLKIRCIKIHGDQYQERGVSDYLINYLGFFSAIEFKVYPEIPTDYQVEFLNSILKTNGRAFIIVFVKDNLRNNESELEIFKRPAFEFVRQVYWYYQ